MVNQLLQTNDLAYMRSEVKLVMPDTVDIQRMSQEGDGQSEHPCTLVDNELVGFVNGWKIKCAFPISVNSCIRPVYPRNR